MNYKLSNLVSKAMLITSFLIILLLGSAWFSKEYYDYNNSINILKEEYTSRVKKDISQEINRVISLTEYNHSLKMIRIKSQVKQRIDEAYELIEKIYKKNNDSMSKEEITELIKESLRNIRFFDKTGYYFIYDTNGKNILHPLRPEAENTYKFKNFTDLNGKEVLTNWIKDLETNDANYDTWTFYRVDDVNKQALKVGYYKLFKPYNYIIATADYLYRVEEELKKETLNRIRQLEYGKMGNIFVLTQDGQILVSKYLKELEGKSYSEFTNNQTKRVIKKILLNSTSQGSYISYDWLLPNSKIYQKKLTYIKNYDKWNWIIGTGVFLDEIENTIALKKEQLNRDIQIQFIIISFVVILVVLVAFILNRYLRNKIKNSLEVFLMFFKDVNEKNEKINLDKIEFYEFSKIAKYANKMIDVKIKTENELNYKNKELLVNMSLVEEYKKAVDAGAIVSKADIKGSITYVNDQFINISGYSKDELLDKNHNILRHEDVSSTIYKTLWKRILNKKIWKGIFKNRAKDGSTYFVKSTVVPILDIDSNIKEFIAIMYDITDLVEQAKIIKTQTTDILTNLPNRQKLLEDLSNQDNLKLLVMNIQRFKEINEYYGYEIGDKTLKEVSSVLEEIVYEHNLKLYKLPGDEFAILGSQSVDINEFKSMIKNLIKQLTPLHVTIEDNSFDINFVAGVSFIKNYLINAEMAKNHAKQENQRLIFFDENTDIKENLVNNMHLTQKLKQKIKEEKMVVVIQPIISNLDGSINKYECLIRMEDEGNLVSPIKFLHVAKKSNLYHKLTRIVVEKAFEYFSKRDDCFSINLTIEDILDKKTVNFIEDSLSNYPDISKQVIFEIVEDEGIENYEEVLSFIENMKSLGCKIAIDDFGTGYSNFDYLMKLNVDYVKIDGSMIRYLTHDENAKVVTELVVQFAKKLNIKTIAEFVHSKEIYEIVKEMGIDYSQGFYLGEPKRVDLD